MTVTAISNIRWGLYVYPWSPVYPSGGGGVSDLLGTSLSGSSGSPGEPQPAVLIKKGITYMSFQRSKTSHDNLLRVQMVGQVHPSLLIGNWVVLKSTTQLQPTGDLEAETEDSINQVATLNIPRFIGQIYSIDTEYEKNGQDGTFYQVTTITIKEWSHVFDMAIRYDEAVIIESLSSTPGFGLAIAQEQNQLTSEQMIELTSRIFNPFEFVHLLLSLIGGISSDETLMDSSIQGITLPALALKLPVVPKTLLDDLGISGGNELGSIVKGKLPSLGISSSGENPFAAGFSTTITGVLKDSLHNDGQWDGLFDPGEIKDMATGDLYNKKPKGRPATAGLTPILSQGLSSWQMIQGMCDADFNEVFSDILYERTSDGKGIVAKPVLWVRDKPFASKKLFLKNKKLYAQGEWSKYDDLPRVYIPTAYIEKLSFNVSKSNAINYIKLEFLPGLVTGDTTRTLSTLKGTLRNKQDEMLRFGGNEMFAKTNYISQDFVAAENTNDALGAVAGAASGALASLGVGEGNPQWFEQLRDILDIWWGSYYKTPTARLIIKDYSVPISVGLNATFIIGGIQLVGHIVSTSTAIQIDASGNHSTETVIMLDRIMKTEQDPVENGQKFGLPSFVPSALAGIGSLTGGGGGLSILSDLDFIDPVKLNNLIYKHISQEGESGSSSSQVTKLLNKATNALNLGSGNDSPGLDKTNTDPTIA